MVKGAIPALSSAVVFWDPPRENKGPDRVNFLIPDQLRVRVLGQLAECEVDGALHGGAGLLPRASRRCLIGP